MTPLVGISCANQLSVSESASPLPDMSGTIQGYFRPLTMVRVQKNVVEHRVVEVRSELRCQGVIQPFGPRELRMKPEGQRAWNWQMLHCTPEVELKDDEEFLIGRTRYRVMSQIGYQDYGFRQFELVQDYQ